MTPSNLAKQHRAAPRHRPPWCQESYLKKNMMDKRQDNASIIVYIYNTQPERREKKERKPELVGCCNSALQHESRQGQAAIQLFLVFFFPWPRISCQKMMMKFLVILPENFETPKLSDVSWCRTRNSSAGGGIWQNARVLRKEKDLHQISAKFVAWPSP